MTAIDCRYETGRLSVRPWRARDRRPRTDEELAAIVMDLLSARVTATLPDDWQGPYDRARALAWVVAREADASVSLVSLRADAAPVGLVLLHASVRPGRAGLELRIGYLLAERSWGQGLGGELVGGLVVWARETPSVAELCAGSAAENVASIRLLERNGFERARSSDPTGEASFRLAVGSDDGRDG